MRFIKLSRLLLPLVCLLFTACQMLPKQVSPADKETTRTEQATGAMISPNPYLANRPAVPGYAKQEFQKASAAMLEQDWLAAEQQLLLLTLDYPHLSGPYLNLAIVYDQQGNVDLADENFRQAIAANTNNVFAYNQYGIFLREQGRFDEAEQQYLSALAVWPDYAEGHRNLGILYDMYFGNFSQALAQYKLYQSLQEQPDRQLKGWIIDLQRRIKSQAKANES